jgi:hypothetical protein
MIENQKEFFTHEIVGEKNETIILRSDGAWIPTDPANSDYAEYLASLEEPNLPEVEETPETSEAE